MRPPFSSAAKTRRYLDQEEQTEIATADSKDAHGSSEWMLPSEIERAKLHDNAKPFIMGRAPDGDFLRYDGDGHILTFAPTGAGKGVSVVVPNLLEYPGSVVCIDPKGAIAAVTAQHRRNRGQKIILFDPFGEVARAQAAAGLATDGATLRLSTCNPFGHLNPRSPDAVDDARLIASGLVLQESEKNRYFSDSARMILEGLILYLLVTRGAVLVEDLFDLAFKPREDFNAQVLSDMKALGEPPEAAEGQEIEEVGELESHIAHMAGLIDNLTGDAGASVWSTLYRSLNLIKSPRLLAAMAPSDVDFSALKDAPTTIYLVLPARRLETHGVWLRLMLAVIMGQLSDARAPRWPVLFMVDECAALGRLEILETAVGLMRGYGLKLWLIFQDLPQLKSIYEKRWGSFISNAGVKQFFNVNDLETADFVSNYLGKETRGVASQNFQLDKVSGSMGLAQIARPLLTSDEVRRLGREEQVLFYEGLKPIRARKIRYFEDAHFEENAAPDPYIIAKQKWTSPATSNS